MLFRNKFPINKSLLLIGFIAANVTFNNLVLANVNSDLLNCSDIKTSEYRLACYDKLASLYKNSLTTATKASTKAHVETKITQLPLTQPKIQNATLIQNFGQAEKSSIQSIQSRIVGNFSHWEKGMKLTLENGQIWKVLNRKSGYKKLSNPRIIITHGVFGSFNAVVDGITSKVKVRRVK